MRMRRAGFSFAVGLLLFLSSDVRGEDSQTLAKLFAGYKSYEGIIVEAECRETLVGQEPKVRRLRMTYGLAPSASNLGPYSIEELVLNPGEPHIESEWLSSEWLAVVDGVSGHFARRFVSRAPYNARNSDVVIDPVASSLTGFELKLAHRAFMMGFGGFPLTDNYGRIKSLSNGVSVSIEDADAFKGLKTKHASLTFSGGTEAEWTGHYLITLEPSVQILQVLGVDASNPDVAKSILEDLAGRKVVDAQVINGRVIPLRIEMENQYFKYELTVTKVSLLAEDHHGLWEFDGPTGTSWGGEVESTSRESANRVEKNRHGSEIPFTSQEQAEIRAFLLSRGFTSKKSVPVGRVIFYVVNGVLLLVVFCKFGLPRMVGQNDGKG